MKLEVGMYVRTKKYGIAKIIGGISDKFNIDVFKKDGYTLRCQKERDILKASFNIIDLIEEGDYVNGEKVIALKKDISERNIHFNSKKCNIFTDYSLAENWYFGIEDKDIKSIVTKEQYKNIEYRIGE